MQWIGLLAFALRALFGAFTTPRTWANGETPDEDDMNTHIRDNMDALKTPPSGVVNFASAITTTSTSFVDLTGASITFTTTGGDVRVSFYVTLRNSSTGWTEFDILLDAVSEGGSAGIVRSDNEAAVADAVVGFTRVISGLAAASHTFKIQWRVQSGTSTINSGSQYVNQFSASEVG